uniref:Uncharacterized protein n=1 Tax=Anguilla anguilla TaxID=7936 RepID=A0A0E9WKA0_ANGAN
MVLSTSCTCFKYVAVNMFKLMPCQTRHLYSATVRFKRNSLCLKVLQSLICSTVICTPPQLFSCFKHCWIYCYKLLCFTNDPDVLTIKNSLYIAGIIHSLSLPFH